MGGPSYIPFTEIEAYCRLKNIFLPSEMQRLVRLIDRLDRRWMEKHLEKIEKEAGRGNPTPPPPSHSPPRHKPRRSTRTEAS